MGTNYYLFIDDYSHYIEGQPGKIRIHIGKSSGGWVFALHAIPERNLMSLDDWLKFLSEMTSGDYPRGIIEDEYGCKLTLDNLCSCITQRSWGRSADNLIRSRVDGSHCIGQGAGTWEMIAGEFS